jgi:hypothetical protein
MMAVSAKLEQIASINFALLEINVKATALVKQLLSLIHVNALLILNVLQDIALLLILARIPAQLLMDSAHMVTDATAQELLIVFLPLATLIMFALQIAQQQLHMLIIAIVQIILNA